MGNEQEAHGLDTPLDKNALGALLCMTNKCIK